MIQYIPMVYMLQVKEVVFHVSPTKNEMDKDYFVFIDEVKQEIRRQRLRITLNANVDMVCLYWNIGYNIFQKQNSRMTHENNQTFVQIPFYVFARMLRSVPASE